MPEREWSYEDLQYYASHFPDGQVHDAVLNEVVKAELLEKYLMTTEGRIILDNVVENITGQLMAILKMADEGFDKNVEAIRDACHKVNTGRRFMVSVASIALTGKAHVEAMKKVKRGRPPKG